MAFPKIVPPSWSAGPLGLDASIPASPLDYPPFPEPTLGVLAAATVETSLNGAITAASPADGGNLTVVSTTGFDTPTNNDLDGAITAAAVTVTLTDASGLAEAGVVKIGSEQILYRAKSSNDLLDCQRGYRSTTAATHADAAVVTQPSSVNVDGEIVDYFTKTATLLQDVRRHSAKAHADGAPVGALVDITLQNASAWPDEGAFRVGVEEFSFGDKSSNTLQGIMRGVGGTAIVAHTSEAQAFLIGYRLHSTVTGAPPFQNNHGSDLTGGIMVTLALASGGGFVEMTQGDPLLGVLSGAVADGSFGVVNCGGFASFVRDPALVNDPEPGRPVFAKTSSTVMAEADAASGDQAVGYCMAVHSKDPDGNDLDDPRVDFICLPQLRLPYAKP